MNRKTIRHVALLFSHRNIDERERLSGALRYAGTKQDWEVRVLDVSSSDFESEFRRTYGSKQADGLICTYPFRDLVQRLGGARFLVEGDPIDPDDTGKADAVVSIDADSIATEIVSLLRRRGFTNFGFYGTDKAFDVGFCEIYHRSIRKALAKEGLGCHSHDEAESDDFTKALRSTAEWIRTLPKPCAIAAYSDELARNVLDAARMAKVSVPEQLAIIGLDNDATICELTSPTLSSAHPDFERCGYLAAEALDRAMTFGRHRYCRRLSYGLKQIVERASTQDLRNCGRIAVAAQELIRTLPLDELDVDALAARVKVSRRLLEIHFRTITGRSPHAEILRRRLEEMKGLLRATDRPIGDIAFACGFKSLNTAQVAFRRAFGISMRTFRTEVHPGGRAGSW